MHQVASSAGQHSLLRRVCRSVFLTLVLLEVRRVCCPTAAAQLQMLTAVAATVSGACTCLAVPTCATTREGYGSPDQRSARGHLAAAWGRQLKLCIAFKKSHTSGCRRRGLLPGIDCAILQVEGRISCPGKRPLLPGGRRQQKVGVCAFRLHRVALPRVLSPFHRGAGCPLGASKRASKRRTVARAAGAASARAMVSSQVQIQLAVSWRCLR